jgi:hypothetical protein
MLYFSVCKSIPGQEPLRYRTCHDRKQVCKQYTDQTHTFMINHTGQQKQKGDRTCVSKAYSSNLHFSKTFKVQGTRVCKRYKIYNRMHKDSNH